MRYCFLRFPGGKFKAVTFSYDDGVRQDLRFAEILDRYGLKGTFNINSGFLGASNRTTVEEIKEHILGKGHEVALHGKNHMAPGAGLKPVMAITDILDCRKELEATFDMIIRGMAYPDSGVRAMHNGNDYENLRTLIENIGVVYSRSLAGDNDSFMLPCDFLCWIPTAHHKNPALFDMVKKFLEIDETRLYSSAMYPRLFYLWGHTYEFDKDDGWNLIEKFCSEISGKDDTWYATNIEICDYVMAYNSLVTSANGKKIYNPTLMDIWMNVDGKTIVIKSGETINL